VIDNEWIYLIVINNKIVKIGGTRTGLASRACSYLCGHHVPERNKSGKCSITNAHVYNTCHFYLTNDYIIEMYAYKIPAVKVSLNAFDDDIDVSAQVYHAYESILLKKYKSITGHYPFLSDNADPNYK
jgi:hypothetical protein